MRIRTLILPRGAAMRLMLLAVVVISGCADSTAPVPPESVNGSWGLVRAPTDPPGSSTSFILSLTGTSIIGDGHFAGEAGPFGTIAISGVLVGDSVQLDLTFKTDPMFVGVAARHAVFRGRLTSATAIVGVAAYDGEPAYPISFRKACSVAELPCAVAARATRLIAPESQLFDDRLQLR